MVSAPRRVATSPSGAPRRVLLLRPPLCGAGRYERWHVPGPNTGYPAAAGGDCVRLCWGAPGAGWADCPSGAWADATCERPLRCVHNSARVCVRHAAARLCGGDGRAQVRLRGAGRLVARRGGRGAPAHTRYPLLGMHLPPPPAPSPACCAGVSQRRRVGRARGRRWRRGWSDTRSPRSAPHARRGDDRGPRASRHHASTAGHRTADPRPASTQTLC